MRRPFKRRTDQIEVRLTAEEHALLERLPALLASVGAGSDPATERLNPETYPNDGAAQQEYSRLMEAELRSARKTDEEAFASSLASSGSMSLEEAEAWMRVIGDARLTLAARKGLDDDDERWEERAPHDPDLSLLLYLGYLQDSLVDVLSEGLPEEQ